MDHPEGVTVGPDGYVYAGGEAGQIYRIDPNSRRAVQLGSSGGFTLGVALDGTGSVYACDPTRHGVVVFSPAGKHCDYASRPDIVGAAHPSTCSPPTTRRAPSSPRRRTSRSVSSTASHVSSSPTSAAGT